MDDPVIEPGHSSSRHLPEFPPLVVLLRPSRHLRACAVFVHGLPLITCLGEGVPLWVRAVVITCVAASAFLTWRRMRWLNACELILRGADSLGLRVAGVEHGATLTDHRDLGVCVTLCWREASGARGCCALMPDGLPAEVWRGLRIRLRWGVLPQGD